MSKINNLLKKASFFEKLAIFGDRKNFLKSIAQAAPKVKTISDMGDPELSPALPFDESNQAKYWQAALDDSEEIPEMTGEDLSSVPTKLPTTTEYTTPANFYVRNMQQQLIQLANFLQSNKASMQLGGLQLSSQDISNLKNIGQNAKNQEDGFWGPLTSKALDVANDITLRLDNSVLYDFMFDKTRNAQSALHNAETLNKLIGYLNSQEFKKKQTDEKAIQLGNALNSIDLDVQKKLKNSGGVQGTSAADAVLGEFDSAWMPDSI